MEGIHPSWEATVQYIKTAYVISVVVIHIHGTIGQSDRYSSPHTSGLKTCAPPPP